MAVTLPAVVRQRFADVTWYRDLDLRILAGPEAYARGGVLLRGLAVRGRRPRLAPAVHHRHAFGLCEAVRLLRQGGSQRGFICRDNLHPHPRQLDALRRSPGFARHRFVHLHALTRLDDFYDRLEEVS